MLSRRFPLALLPALVALLPVVARAEEPLLWAGVGGDSGLRVGADGVSGLTSQVELDVRAASGPVYLQLDLDAHVDPNVPEFYTYPIPPEEAFVQVGRKAFRVKAGVSNPNVGLSGWDAWENYYPTHPLNFDLLCGQVLGADVGVNTESGWELAAFGGQDLAWAAPVVGAYAATEQDAFGTWSGAMVWPTLGYFAAFPSVEVYPTGWLWVDVDGVAGMAEGHGFGGGQLVLNILPESQPNPVLRVQKLIDPKGATQSDTLGLDLPDTSASFTLNTDPTDYLRVSGEGKIEWRDGEAQGVGILYIALHPIEPDDDLSTAEDESAAE